MNSEDSAPQQEGLTIPPSRPDKNETGRLSGGCEKRKRKGEWGSGKWETKQVVVAALVGAWPCGLQGTNG